MGNLFKPDVIFLVLLLVLPGVISQSIFNTLVSRGKDRNIETNEIFRYMLHSIVVYVILYTITALICNVDVSSSSAIKELTTKTRWRPLGSVIVIAIASFSWGIVYSMTYRSNIVKNILLKLGNVYEPPNVLSRILDEKYQDEDSHGSSFWLTVKEGDYYVVGLIINAATERTPREIRITNVSFQDDEGNVIRELPENTSLVIKVDDYSYLEIKEIKPSIEA